MAKWKEYPREGRFLLVEFGALDDVRTASIRSGMPEGEFGWAVVQLWAHCVRQSKATITPITLAGFFGPERADMAGAAMTAVGLLRTKPDGMLEVVLPRSSNKRVGGHGCVYFVQAASGLIKIGFATDLARRLSALKTSTADRLDLLASMPGTLTDEEATHERFKHLHREREWFEPGPDLLAFIASLKEQG